MMKGRILLPNHHFVPDLHLVKAENTCPYKFHDYAMLR